MRNGYMGTGRARLLSQSVLFEWASTRVTWRAEATARTRGKLSGWARRSGARSVICLAQPLIKISFVRGDLFRIRAPLETESRAGTRGGAREYVLRSPQTHEVTSHHPRQARQKFATKRQGGTVSWWLPADSSPVRVPPLRPTHPKNHSKSVAPVNALLSSRLGAACFVPSAGLG